MSSHVEIKRYKGAKVQRSLGGLRIEILHRRRRHTIPKYFHASKLQLRIAPKGMSHKDETYEYFLLKDLGFHPQQVLKVSWGRSSVS
jgi:hypothetical protein